MSRFCPCLSTRFGENSIMLLSGCNHGTKTAAKAHTHGQASQAIAPHNYKFLLTAQMLDATTSTNTAAIANTHIKKASQCKLIGWLPPICQQIVEGFQELPLPNRTLPTKEQCKLRSINSMMILAGVVILQHL